MDGQSHGVVTVFAGMSLRDHTQQHTLSSTDALYAGDKLVGYMEFPIERKDTRSRNKLIAIMQWKDRKWKVAEKQERMACVF